MPALGPLLHMSFANYAAGAIMMPYGRFLARRRGASLCDRPPLRAVRRQRRADRAPDDDAWAGQGARGVPFFMLRVDPAGNISKRYAGENFPFSHFGGTCPRWNFHAAFQTPGQTIRQLIETPDGQRFFTISRTIERPIRPELRDDALLAIGLGCDVRYAPRIAYADGLDLANTPATPGRARMLSLPEDGVRLSGDAAGRADACGARESQDDLAFPVPARLGRDRLALEPDAIPFREIGRRFVGRLKEARSAAPPGSPRIAPPHKAGCIPASRRSTRRRTPGALETPPAPDKRSCRKRRRPP